MVMSGPLTCFEKNCPGYRQGLIELHLKQVLQDCLSQSIQYFTAVVNRNMMGWYSLHSLITSVKLTSFAEEMGYYCLKYLERIQSFIRMISNNRDFKKWFYLLPFFFPSEESCVTLAVRERDNPSDRRDWSDGWVSLRVQVVRWLKPTNAPRALTLVMLNSITVSVQFELIYVLICLFFPLKNFCVLLFHRIVLI